MLIRCSVENWMSFRDRTCFSMIASKERQHKDRISYIPKYKINILPIAAIYGGNASGKTNFFKALNFVKDLVVKGTQPDSIISIDNFRLDAQKSEQPSRFMFELLIDESIYEFSFSVTQRGILEEKLVLILSASEKILYERKNNKVIFDKSIAKDQALVFAFNGTRDNQLFLTNTVSQKIEHFRSIYDWFKYNLELVAPDSRFAYFEQFLDEGHPLYAIMSKRFSQLDTGIIRLGSEELAFDNLFISDPIKMKMRQELTEGMSVRLLTPGNELIVITRKNGELIAKKLITFHKKTDGSEIKFEIRQESDGSQRIIDLLPAFTELSALNSKKVYIIDEVDRSLHTLLTRQLIKIYLSACSPETRSQLLFTTHDVLLMDQDLLRRDEMWVAERDFNGVSDLLSFSEYKDIRYDKDIRKSYLQGRLGGIPRILLNSTKG